MVPGVLCKHFAASCFAHRVGRFGPAEEKLDSVGEGGNIAELDKKAVHAVGYYLRHSARQRAYYWIGLRRRKATPPADSDVGAVYDKYIAVTPLHLNLTEPAVLTTLRSILGK